MLRIIYISLIGLLAIQVQSVAQDTAQATAQEKADRYNNYILKRVNQLRTKGCKCGRKRMKPTHPLTWNKTLEYSAYLHAEQMDKHNFFAHQSVEGLDIGERLDEVGYKWQYVGENLAEGQKSLEEALKDWIESPSHCLMLMNPDMKEMGLSRYGKYWVHHFGTPMPPNTRKGRTYYKEG